MKNLILILSASLFFITGLNAQSAANYSFSSVATGTLTTMTGSTNLITGSATTNVASAVANIGFTFYYMGTAYTQFSVNSNGQMRLGATAIAGAAQSVALSTALLVPFNGSNLLPTGGLAQYVITGTSPNRVLNVEWVGLNIPSTVTGTTSQMQVRIHESTGVIEYIYGAMYNNKTGTALTASIYFSSSNTANTVGSLYTFTTSPAYYSVATPYTTSLTNSSVIPILNSTTNGSRRIFTFTPPAQPTAPTWAATPITNLTGNGMTLNWNDNSTTETGYQIYNSTDNVTFTLVTTLAANSTTYTAAGLKDVTTYYWKVVAFNEGTAPTSTSVISQATPLAAPTWAATPITLPTTSGMTLNWIDNSSSETGYKVYNSTDNITFNLVTTTAANITTYAATGLSTFTVYYWKVAAVSGVTTSAFTPVSSLSTLDITPVAPTWAATPVTNPTTAGMTLHWMDNSTNETGFEIYRSTDNVTFTKIATTATNATSYTASGLTLSTLYYWKVDAVNSGGSSTQTTVSSLSTTATSTIISVATGNWSSGSTWSTGSVPALTDDVIISNGNAVTIDATINTAKTLTVNGSLVYNATTASTLTVNGTVTIALGGSFTSPASGTVITHALNIGGSAFSGPGGDLVVNGIFDMNVFSTAGVIVTFFGTTNNILSGTGTSINFYSIVENKGTTNGPILDVQSLITCADATSALPLRLSITSGTFKISSSSILRPFYGTVQPTQTASRLWLNNATANIQGIGAGTAAGPNGTLTFMGILQIDAGTLSYGNGASNLSCTGNFMMNGVNSTLNVYGSFYSSSGSTYTITGGNINIYPQVGVNYVPAGYFTQGGLFLFTGPTLNFTGGTLTFVDPTPAVSTGYYYAPYSLYINGGTNNFAGSTIRFGDGISDLAGGIGFTISPSNAPLGNVIVNNSPSSVSTTRNVTLLGNVSIGGNLIVNGGAANKLVLSTFALTLAGNITNAGTIVSNNVTTNSLAFNGTTKQTVSNAGIFLTNISNLTINNTSGALPSVDLQLPLTVSTGLTLTNGQLGSSNASVLTLGNSAGSTILGMTRSGGSLAGLPTFALGGVTYNATYAAPAVAAGITTGFELPASTNLGTFTVNNPSGVVLDKAVACTTLALTSGILTSSAVNKVTITGTLPTNLTGGSSTSYINGPLTLTIPNNASGANYKFPIGKTTYHLFEFSSLSTGGTGTGTFTAEAFDAGPYAGTAGTGLSAINTDKYWTLTGALGSVTIATSSVRLTDVGLNATNRIGQSNTVTGVYNTVGGSVTGGTTVSSVNTIDYSTIGTGTDFRVGAATGFASGTYAIGPTGAYPSITAAVTAITGVPLSGNVIFEFQSTYVPTVETFPIVLTPNIISNANATVTFRPAAGVGSVINFSGTTSILMNSGADYVVFDGRNGGTGTNQYLQFTSSSTTAPTILLSGDAQYNSFLYSTLKGSTTAISTGILTLNTPTLGNNYLKVDHCNFDASGTANNCIYTTGLATNDTITNNNFHEYRNGAGINLASGSDNADVDANSFYQTIPYNGIAGTTSGIIVTGGNNVRISNNNIGGNAPAGSISGPWTISPTSPVACNFTGINATTLATTSKIYNNKIQNFNWTTTTSSWTGINVSGTVNVGTDGANYVGDNTTTGNITLTGYTTSGTITFNGISTSGAANTYVDNNIIGSVKTAANGAIVVNSTMYPIYGSGGQIIRNNIVGSPTIAQSVNATTTGTNIISGINCGGSSNTVTGNTISNMYSVSAGVSSTMRGISNASTGNLINNTVINLTSLGANPASGTSASLIGILGGGGTITGNIIYNIANTASGAVVVYGILYYGTDGGTSSIVDKNLVHSIVTSSNTAIQMGINLSYGTAVIKNNVIRLGIDTGGNSITSTAQITGISVAPAVGCCVAPLAEYVYFNTVYVGGSSVVAGTVKTFAFVLVNHSNYSGSGLGEDIRNNIFVNMRTNTTANPLNYAISLPAPMPAVPHTCDYNIYNVSATDGKLAIVNAVDQLSLKALQDSYSGISNIHSGYGDPQLTNPTAALASMDLRPNISSTEAEGTGINIPIVTDDFTGALRSSNTPTDIGAYSGLFTLASLPVDIFAPTIVYNPIGNGSSTTSRLTANFAIIIDNANGINVTSGTRPRLYYKLPANSSAFGGNTSADNGWKYVEATGTNIPFNFNIDYSLLYGGPVALGSTIQYFVVAQNSAPVPVVSFSPSIGASGTSVASVLTAPTTLNSYTIVPSFPSAVNVGTGQLYTTLTGAGGLFAALNAGTINANTLVTITSDITEPGTTSLNLVSEEGPNAGALTLTIQPDGNQHVISGIAVATTAPMISITGAKRLFIDGGARKLLTFRNTNATAISTGPVIQFSNNSQCTILNCYVESNSTSTTSGALTIGTGTNIITINQNDIRDARGGTAGSPTNGIYCGINTVNLSNTINITNNNIYNLINSASNGIYIYSGANGCNITGNSFYVESGKSAVGPYTGILLQSSKNDLVSGNFIGGSAPVCGSVPFAFSGNANFTGIYNNCYYPGVVIQGNTIQNLNLSSSAPTFYGINNYFTSVTISGNTIGSPTTANSIQIAGTGTSYGIYQSYSLALPCIIEKNTVANITLTNATGSPSFAALQMTGGTVTKNIIYGIGSSNSALTPKIYGISNLFGTTVNEFSNNMINLNGGASANPTLYGFYDNSSTGTTGLYFNSINLYGTSTGINSTYCYFRDYNSTGAYVINMNNNIAVNSRTGGTGIHYAMYSIPATQFNSNNNDLYVAGTTLGHYGAAGVVNDKANLAAWQVIPLDVNSISVDPLFTSPTAFIPDLTLQAGSPVISAGKPVTGIPVDLLGTIRSLTTPSLGVYEYYVGSRSLTLTAVLLEGLYNGTGTMRQAQDASGNHWPTGVADHITVELHNSLSYGTIIYSVTDVPLSTSGIAALIIPALYNGNYYITIKHRNSLETTTSIPVSFAGSTINQSFGLPANVFGGNLGVSTDGSYLIYAGDVNQDGFIDSQDYIGVDNDLSNFASGYLSTDVDGNGTIDSRDFISIDNSNYNFIGTSHP